MQQPTVTLVCRRLEHDDDLELAHLRAALATRGWRGLVAVGAFGSALLSSTACGGCAAVERPGLEVPSDPTGIVIVPPRDARPSAAMVAASPASPLLPAGSAQAWASTARPCPPSDGRPPEDRLRALLGAHVGCFSGWVDTSRSPAAPHFQADGPFSSWPTALQVCGGDVAAVETRARDVLDRSDARCASSASGMGGFAVTGGASKDMERLARTLASCQPDASFTISLDEAGQVRDVRSSASASTPVQCMRSALRGLTFPCLGNVEVCPESLVAR